MNQFSSNLHTVSGKKRKLLLVTITAFFLFSFLITNGQNPTVSINQAAAQPDPTNSSPINFTVQFDQPVVGFTTGDVILSGTAGAIGAVVTGGPMLFNVSAFGMISCGTVIANIPAGVCTNTLTQPNLASTSLDNTVTLLTGNPNVTINQAVSQPNPTNQAPINFTVLFDQLVTGFATGDVSLSGTAGATTAIVTGSGATYNVAVSGMTASGTVIATIAAGVAQACTQPNNASTSTDNTVTITCVPPVVNVTPAISCGGIAGGAGPCNALTASGNADVYIWTPLAGLYTNCSATAPYIGDNRAIVYAAPTVNTIYTVTGTILATGCSNTASAQVNYTPPAPVIVPSSVNMCLGDPPVKLKVTTGGIPATPAVWSPIAGLFSDQSAAIPYVGNAIDSVWVRPTPAGVYTYQVTTQGIPVLLCSPATNFVSNNGDGLLTFNVKNNHAFPIRLLQINSKTLTAAQTSVSVYYKASAINGPPGFISAANGWNQFGGASITGTGTGIQPFLTNLQLTIPPGVTYGICLRATTFTSVPNLAFSSLSPGNHSFNDGGCELITGTNIGYSGNTNTPATPLSGFVGSVQFADVSTCTSPPRSVVVTVGQGVSVTSQPANVTQCGGTVAVFSAGVAGSGPFTYQWQVSSSGPTGPYTNLANAAPYSGNNTPTLTISPVSDGMNGQYYMLRINGGCGSASTIPALLTVVALPTATITANPLTISNGQTTTIRSAVTPSVGITYTWYYNGSVLPGAAADTLLVQYGSPGDYQLKVTNLCGVATSNIITIANSFALNLVAHPNPNSGRFQVTYYSGTNNAVQRTMNIFNNKGDKVMTKAFTQTIPYQKIDVDVRANGKGIYWVELVDGYGRRLAMNKVVVQ